jgi:plastocyanin
MAVGLFAAGSAFGVAQNIVAADNTFSLPTYTMDQGDRPVLQNMGVNQHNVTASTNGPDGKPLFSSATIGTGNVTLNGTQFLTTGTYSFICSIHPTTMIATLAVSANGAAAPRPTIALKVIGKDIEKAIKRGLRVKMDLGSKSDDIALEAKLGKTVIGGQAGISQAQGTSFQQLKLNKKGRRKLSDRDKATVTVTGTLPFGAPTATRARLKEK